MMKSGKKTTIVVAAKINAPLELVWKHWTTPQDIINWNQASDDWHTPLAENDLRQGGRFLYRMEARDGSTGFDFAGVYTDVQTNKQIGYTIDDGRKVRITFSTDGKSTEVMESFEAEGINPVELQRSGWQAILDNFKKYSENLSDR